jgi:hypothetical protein
VRRVGGDPLPEVEERHEIGADAQRPRAARPDDLHVRGLGEGLARHGHALEVQAVARGLEPQRAHPVDEKARGAQGVGSARLPAAHRIVGEGGEVASKRRRGHR